MFNYFFQKWQGRQKENNLKRFYERQNNLVEKWKSDEDFLLASDNLSAEEEAKRKIWDTRISTITIILNLILIIAKTVAAYLSGSLAILASLVDSFMDITSGVVVWYACKKIEKTDRERYPVGMTKLEPLIVVIVGMIMLFANFLIVYQTIFDTATNNIHPTVDILTGSILLAGTCIKIVLYLVCRARSSIACMVLATDQRNDCFTNVVAFIGAYVGQHYWPYVDPICAFLVSCGIIVTWIMTMKEHIPFLIGRAAKPEFMHRITNIAMNHDERIKKLDTVTVYHFGANYLVEVHVVFDAPTTLDVAHDISEELQFKLERLPYVERAFVHCDYTNDGNEHFV